MESMAFGGSIRTCYVSLTSLSLVDLLTTEGLNCSLKTSNVYASTVLPSHHLALLLVLFIPQIHQLYHESLLLFNTAKHKNQ